MGRRPVPSPGSRDPLLHLLPVVRGKEASHFPPVQKTDPLTGRRPSRSRGMVRQTPPGEKDPGIVLTGPAQIEYDSFQKAPSAISFPRPVSPGPLGEAPGRFFIPLGNLSASVHRNQGGECIREDGANDPKREGG